MRRTGACHEHRADADISFLAKGKDHLMSAYTLLYDSVLPCSILGIISRPPTPIDVFLYHTGLLRRLSTSHYPDGYGRLSPCKFREAWWICKYRKLFREQVHAELPAEIPCTIINSPLLFLAQRIVYSWRDKPMSFKKNFSEAILL